MFSIYIQNISELLNKDLDKNQLYLRKIILETLEIAIKAVKPQNLIKSSIKIKNNILTIQNDDYDLKKVNKLYIVGGGKAAADMALSLENILNQNKEIKYQGLINVPKDSVDSEKLKQTKIKINYASHPIPDKGGLDGAKEMVNLIENSTTNDLILFLISGGGSALLPLPIKGISLEDIQILNTLLLESGASIHEINVVRKHISAIKGGNIARTTYTSSGAKLISLIISDVVGDNLDIIASGPTVPDTSTFHDAHTILNKYTLYEKVPESIRIHISNGLKDEKLENPKYNDKSFNNVHNYVIGTVEIAVEKAISFLEAEGFKTHYFSNEIAGEAVEYGKNLYRIVLKRIEDAIEKDISGKLALIGTGELTVTIKGNGIGGRNQEMLLSFLNSVEKQEIDWDFAILGANLDGIEGNSHAMGALIDNDILKRRDKKSILKYLKSNDSNCFFKLNKTEIVTGLTGCNVNDLVIVLLQIRKK
ncbi:MAG: glycerate kinase [Promethearchaeota archaeon]